MVLAPIFGDFLTENPNVKLALDYTDRFVDLIQEGGDIAIRIADLPDSNLIARTLSSMQMIMCASPDFIQKNSIERIEDLQKVPCFKYLDAPQWHLLKDGKEVLFTPKGPIESNSGEALREIAIAGSGVAYLPDFIVQNALKKKQLVSVLPSHSGWVYNIHAVFPNNRHRPLRLRRLIDFLVGEL